MYLHCRMITFFHLAAQPGISADTSLQEYVDNNIYATQNLLEAVLQYNPNLKSFVNIATSSVLWN